MSFERAKCPDGHELPHGNCTPRYCEGSFNEGKERQITNFTDPHIEPSKKPKRPITLDKHNLQYSEGRRGLRREKVPVPEGLKGAEAEQYTASKLVELTPEAVSDLEYDLKYGDDRVRQSARKEVLDRAGFVPKDRGNSAAGPILIVNANGGGGRIEVPWLERGVAVEEK